MIAPAQIRKAALSLLYAMMETGASADEFDYGTYWHIGIEPERDRLRTAQARAVLHCLRHQDDTLRLLGERVQAALNALHGDGTASKLREQLETYLDYSQKLFAATRALQYCLVDKRRDGTEQVERCSTDVMVLAATLVELSGELTAMFLDWPAYRAVLSPIEHVVRRRLRFLQECTALRQPSTLESDPQYSALANLDVQVRELPIQAEQYARAVIASRDAFESQLAPVLEHYSSERLAMVDKCILYMALYELSRGLKVQIVVAEATDLAHAYSGSKSARFIHGIIGAVVAKRDS